MSNAGGATSNTSTTKSSNKSMTEERLPNILALVSKQGHNTFLKGAREPLRATSKGVRAGINRITPQMYPVNETSENIPANFIQTLHQAIEVGDRAKINSMLGGNTVSTGLFRQARITPELLDTPIRHDGSTVLYAAVTLNDLETVQLLLARGVNPNGRKLPDGITLAEQGALVNGSDPRAISFPTTNRAAYNANLPMLQALVEAGANINATGVNGHSEEPVILTALECALNIHNPRECGGHYKYDLIGEKAAADPGLFQKYIDIFYYALDNGGDVNVTGTGIRTPLRSAVALARYDPGAIAIVQDLLYRGANPDVRETLGSLISAREYVDTPGRYIAPELIQIMSLVPDGGYPQGGATSGGRRKKRRASRKSKKATRKQTKRR